jgi:hypothetical protein
MGSVGTTRDQHPTFVPILCDREATTMNNGLHGRYLEQLEQWNTARTVAKELVRAFRRDALNEVENRWKATVSFPSYSHIKSLLTEVLFLSGRDTIDTVARAVMDWITLGENVEVREKVTV